MEIIYKSNYKINEFILCARIDTIYSTTTKKNETRMKMSMFVF